MTAPSLAEKAENKVEVGERRDNKPRRCRIVVALCLLCLITVSAVITMTVFIWKSHSAEAVPEVGCATRNKTSIEWIYWTRVSGDVDVHEAALIDPEERTALMISSEAHKINRENSLAFHDYNKGYVALRAFGMCLVSRVRMSDFDSVREMLKQRMGKRLPLQPVRREVIQSRQMTPSELGEKLSAFCQGAPAHWFDDAPEDGDVVHRDRPAVTGLADEMKVSLDKIASGRLDWKEAYGQTANKVSLPAKLAAELGVLQGPPGDEIYPYPGSYPEVPPWDVACFMNGLDFINMEQL